MGRDERRRWGTVPSRGGESVGKPPVDGGKRQSADVTAGVVVRIQYFRLPNSDYPRSAIHPTKPPQVKPWVTWLSNVYHEQICSRNNNSPG